jgi:hypothetical protein
VHEDRKMKNPVWGKMIQRNVKIMKEAMQKKEKQEGTDQHKQKKGTGKSPQD